MSDVRAFEKNDISEVADLYAQVFLHDQDIDVDGLRRHFEEVYFDHPFRDGDCPSLVYCDKKGAILAFLGVMPRPMRFKDGLIKAAVAGNLMVKGERFGPSFDNRKPPTHGHQLAPVALTKAFFRAPYDLCLTDSAVEPSRRIWDRSGGHAIPICSLRWLRVLKPFSLGLERLEGQGRLRPLVRLSKPIGRLFDVAARPFVRFDATSVPEGCIVDRIEPGEIADELNASRCYDLLPSYSKESLGWLLQMARSRKRYGSLRTLAVRQADRRLLGWAIYTAAEGKVGRTLQFHADPKAVDRTFDCLLHDAAGSGITALSGKVDPMTINLLSRRQCLLSFSAWTLVRARHPDLVQAFLAGKALFSELESEGWTRFVHARPKQEFAVG